MVDRGDWEARDSTSSSDRACQPFWTLTMAYFSLVRNCCESWDVSDLKYSVPGEEESLTSRTFPFDPFDTVLEVCEWLVPLDLARTSPNPFTLALLGSPLAVRLTPAMFSGGGLCEVEPSLRLTVDLFSVVSSVF